jgi:hypothetical protein
VPATGGRVSATAARNLRASVRDFFPASWIRAGNRVRATARGHNRGAGGSYRQYAAKPPELYVPARNAATTVHEYVHHLQY